MKINPNYLLTPVLGFGLLTAGCATANTDVGSESQPVITVNSPDGYTQFGADVPAIELNNPALSEMPPAVVVSHLGAVARVVVTANSGSGVYTRDGTALLHQPRDPIGDPSNESVFLTPANTLLKPGDRPEKFASGCGSVAFALTSDGRTTVTDANWFGVLRKETPVIFSRGPKNETTGVRTSNTYSAQPGDTVWIASHPTAGKTVPPATETVPVGVVSATFIGQNHTIENNRARTYFGPDVNIGFFILGTTVEGYQSPAAIASEPGSPVFLGTGDVSHFTVTGPTSIPVGLAEEIAQQPITEGGKRVPRGQTVVVVSAIFDQADAPRPEEYLKPKAC